MDLQEAVQRKQAEIQKDLDIWVKDCGHFHIGQALKLTLSIITVPRVVADTPIEEAFLRETRYYRYVSTALSENDWELLLGSSIPNRCKRSISHLRFVGNVPTPENDLQTHFNETTINKLLRAQRLKFRIERVSFDPEKGRYVQLFKVEPKGDVEGFLEKNWV